MKKALITTLIICLHLIFSLKICRAQPYSGTIFIDPDIIVQSDPSAYQSVNFTGQGNRTVYDRRTASWITINAYLFDVTWDDGLTTEAQVNPEFGSQAAANAEAGKYAWLIGQLPTCLRKDVDAIWIHQGVEPFGGGNRSILIHTGQSTVYENQGILEETLVHEASHTSLDASHATASGWLAAQQLDPNFISTYARDNPIREDIAESFLTWMMVRYKKDSISLQDYNNITQTIPNRLAYFDNMACDLYPFVLPNMTSIEDEHPVLQRENVIIYPNPTTGIIHLKNTGRTEIKISIWDTMGRLMGKPEHVNGEQINLTHLKKGLYFIEIRKKESTVIRKVVKE